MESSTVVLDASIVVKWFHEENDSNVAALVRERILSGELRAVVPPLLFYEVANALNFKAGSQVEDIIASHTILTTIPFQVVEVVYTLMNDAILIAHRHGLSVYDAIYVALAISIDAPMLTADERLFNIIGSPTVKLLRDFE